MEKILKDRQSNKTVPMDKNREIIGNEKGENGKEINWLNHFFLVFFSLSHSQTHMWLKIVWELWLGIKIKNIDYLMLSRMVMAQTTCLITAHNKWNATEAPSEYGAFC